MKTHAAPLSTADPAVLFDEMLVVMAQRGDRRAAEQLYRRWAPRLARAARRYCTGSTVAPEMAQDVAQDLAQECWLAIWKGLPGLRTPGRFRSYAFAVLHRRGADHLRRVIRDRDVVADEEPQTLNQEADESLAEPGERSAIAEAFSRLPPDQALAAHLYFIEGLTLAEIAQVQRTALGTAKSRLFHARRRLKAALDPNFEGDIQ